MWASPVVLVIMCGLFLGWSGEALILIYNVGYRWVAINRLYDRRERSFIDGKSIAGMSWGATLLCTDPWIPFDLAQGRLRLL